MNTYAIALVDNYDIDSDIFIYQSELNIEQCLKGFLKSRGFPINASTLEEMYQQVFDADYNCCIINLEETPITELKFEGGEFKRVMEGRKYKVI